MPGYYVPVISLMVGVFGASFAAIMVLRGWTEKRISDSINSAEDMLHKAVRASGPTKEALSSGKKNLRYYYRALQVIFLVPMAVFFFWAFGVSNFALSNSEFTPVFDYFVQNDCNLPQKQKENTVAQGSNAPSIKPKGGFLLGKIFLNFFWWLNLLSVGVAVVVFFLAWRQLKWLQNTFTTYKNEEEHYNLHPTILPSSNSGLTNAEQQ